jgi:hypothetical protein
LAAEVGALEVFAVHRGAQRVLCGRRAEDGEDEVFLPCARVACADTAGFVAEAFHFLS